MYNKKFHPLEPQSILVVEEDRVKYVVDMVDADPEAADITLLH